MGRRICADNFAPGDLVTVRAWEDMVAEFGDLSEICFTEWMRSYCGNQYVVKSVDPANVYTGEDRTYHLENIVEFFFSDDMLEPPACDYHEIKADDLFSVIGGTV